jgi:hypothetical protein
VSTMASTRSHGRGLYMRGSLRQRLLSGGHIPGLCIRPCADDTGHRRQSLALSAGGADSGHDLPRELHAEMRRTKDPNRPKTSDDVGAGCSRKRGSFVRRASASKVPIEPQYSAFVASTHATAPKVQLAPRFAPKLPEVGTDGGDGMAVGATGAAIDGAAGSAQLEARSNPETDVRTARRRAIRDEREGEERRGRGCGEGIRGTPPSPIQAGPSRKRERGPGSP